MNAKATMRRWRTGAVAVVLATACGCTHGGAAQKTAGVQVPDNFCSLLSASDISRVMGSAFPAAEGSQSPSEAQCTSIPTAGNDVSFKLYRNNEYCIDGKPADKRCLDSQSKGFLANKQSAGQVQKCPGPGRSGVLFCGTTRDRRRPQGLDLPDRGRRKLRASPDLGRDAAGQDLGLTLHFLAARFTADTTARNDAVVIDGAIPTPQTVLPPTDASTYAAACASSPPLIACSE